MSADPVVHGGRRIVWAGRLALLPTVQAWSIGLLTQHFCQSRPFWPTLTFGALTQVWGWYIGPPHPTLLPVKLPHWSPDLGGTFLRGFWMSGPRLLGCGPSGLLDNVLHALQYPTKIIWNISKIHLRKQKKGYNLSQNSILGPFIRWEKLFTEKYVYSLSPCPTNPTNRFIFKQQWQWKLDKRRQMKRGTCSQISHNCSNMFSTGCWKIASWSPPPSSLLFLSSFDCVLFVYCWYGCQRRQFFNEQVASPSAGREAGGECTVRWSGGGLIFTFGRPHSLFPPALSFSFEDFFLFLTGGSLRYWEVNWVQKIEITMWKRPQWMSPCHPSDKEALSIVQTIGSDG